MENERKRISILVPTYNEEENVIPLSEAIIAELGNSLPQYDYDLTFIDNCSTDTTRAKLRALCAENPHIRAIFNARNFGQFNSPYYGICQTTGDCTIVMCADFQDPIPMIPKLVAEWEKGARVVCAVKTSSKENKIIRLLRTCYYKLIRKMSEVEQIEHFTGFGLYDRTFVDVMRHLDDPTPFLRGIIAELGFRKVEVPYTQEKRRAGHTHNNFGSLYDAAQLSFTTYTKTPIRAISFCGALLFALSCVSAVVCLILSLTGAAEIGYWWFAPLAGFLSSLNLIGIGFLGEYIVTLRSKLMHRPLVVEEERINFEER